MEVKPGYKQTEVGVIPEDWEMKAFGKIAQPRKERIDPRRTYPHEFCIELEHIEQRTGCLVGYKSTSEGSSLKSVFQKDDVLFGKLRAYLRKYWLAIREGVCSTEIWVLAAKRPLLIPQFLFQLVKEDRFIEAASSAYGTHMPRSDWKVVENYEVRLPPVPEQEAIAGALSDADALIESLEQLINKKRQIKQGAMQELLIGKKRLPGFEVKPGYKQTEVGVIPEDWQAVSIGSLGKFTKGQGIRKNEASSGDIPCVRYGEIYTYHNDIIRSFDSRISLEVARTSKRLKQGDLLFAGSGETKEEIGKCVAFIGDEEVFAGGDIVILSPNIGVSSFFGYLFNAPIVVHQKGSKGQGDAVVHISATALSEVKIPLPPTEPEQEAIATVLSDMDAEIAALEARLTKARQIKQGMMQELLTGRIRLI
jgi:type I restriction enzyme, S subunit